jgi:hypothetical protein
MDSISKQWNGALYTGLERTTYKFIFSESLQKNWLSAYMENTLNGEKNIESKQMSINHRTT